MFTLRRHYHYHLSYGEIRYHIKQMVFAPWLNMACIQSYGYQLVSASIIMICIKAHLPFIYGGHFADYINRKYRKKFCVWFVTSFLSGDKKSSCNCKTFQFSQLLWVEIKLKKWQPFGIKNSNGACSISNPKWNSTTHILFRPILMAVCGQDN